MSDLIGGQVSVAFDNASAHSQEILAAALLYFGGELNSTWHHD